MTAATAVPVVTTVNILSKIGSVQPGPSITDAPAAPVLSGSGRTYTGPGVSDPFGNVQAAVTVSGNRISGVAITAPMGDPRSSNINSQAIPLLRQETLQAQSANVNVISGATYTSQAYKQSLQAALNQAKLGGTASTQATANSGAPGSQLAVTGPSGGDN